MPSLSLNAEDEFWDIPAAFAGNPDILFDLLAA